MFSMKKLLKKACMFGVSAAMSLNLCSNFVKARTPGADDAGMLWNANAVISPSNDYQYVTVNLGAANTTADGNMKKLIDWFSATGNNGTNYNLYARVSPVSNPTQSGHYAWVLVQENGAEVSNALTNQALMANATGEYNIYLWLDGINNNNYLDNAIQFASNQQQP